LKNPFKTPAAMASSSLVLDLTLDVAATRRLTSIITEEEISRPMREWVSEHLSGSKLEYLVNCPHCVSVWAGAAIGSGIVPRWAKLALALSASNQVVDWLGELSG
jgi:hypothetical protein